MTVTITIAEISAGKPLIPIITRQKTMTFLMTKVEIARIKNETGLPFFLNVKYLCPKKDTQKAMINAIDEIAFS